MSRYFIIVPIPESTPERLVFPLGPNDTFDTTSYNPGLTHGRAGVEEINQVRSELEADFHPFLKKLTCTKIILGICFLLIFFGMAGVGFTMVNSNMNNPAPVFIAFIVGAVCMFGCRFIYKSRVESLATECKTAAQKVLDKHNTSFTPRGLRWVLPTYFPLWVELHKDYLWAQNAGGQQPVYMPPNMYQQPQPQYQNNNLYQQA